MEEIMESKAHLLTIAKEQFANMQRSWWYFAKAMGEIRKDKIYKGLGYQNFKLFCEKEYPTANYLTLVKFTAIVDTWKDVIDAKLSKDSNFKLPSYESCYLLSAIPTDSPLPKEEVQKLRKQVLDSKVSYHGLRDKLKKLGGVPVPEIHVSTPPLNAPTIGELNFLIMRANYLAETLPKYPLTSLGPNFSDLYRPLKSLQGVLGEFLLVAEEVMARGSEIEV